MTIGQRIAQKRKECSLSQEALGERLGVSRQSIYKWESDTALPEIEKLVALAKLFCPDQQLIQAGAGVACVLGQMFPFYLRFKGGKGFASYLGMTIALNWKLALVIVALVLLVTLITDYIVVGTVTTILVVPVAEGIMAQSF